LPTLKLDRDLVVSLQRQVPDYPTMAAAVVTFSETALLHC
jgi:hypothetical protein